MNHPLTYWNVWHPETHMRQAVEADTATQARATAWCRWYGEPPRTELETLTYGVLAVEDTGQAATVLPESSGADDVVEIPPGGAELQTTAQSDGVDRITSSFAMPAISTSIGRVLTGFVQKCTVRMRPDRARERNGLLT